MDGGMWMAALCCAEREGDDMSNSWMAASAGMAVVLMLGAGMRTAPAAAQQQQTPGMPSSTPVPSTPVAPGLGSLEDGPNPIRDSAHEAIVRQANEQRHRRMLDDANKMVQLSNELKADVEKTQKDELSMEVLKKAAEVEKLARDVQQRMKQ
jgi:hypothetical protein